MIPATELTQATASPVQIDLNQVAVPSVTLEAASGKVGEKVALKATVKHIKASSYKVEYRRSGDCRSDCRRKYSRRLLQESRKYERKSYSDRYRRKYDSWTGGAGSKL